MYVFRHLIFDEQKPDLIGNIWEFELLFPFLYFKVSEIKKLKT